MPDITRRQAWMKFAVLIADGLPEPNEIRFHRDGDGITILLDNDTTVAAWADKLGIKTLDRPLLSTNGDLWIHGGSTFNWHGWYVRVSATRLVNPVVPAETADDLSKVRELADTPPATKET